MIQEGEYVILVGENGKKWLIKIRRDQIFSTDLGNVNHDDIIGREYGDKVYTNTGRVIWILKPSLYDYIMKIKRKTQIIYPKDIGYIIVRLGIKPDSKILEIGTGSGALTTGLAWILSGNGVIDTYERRSEFLELARENVLKIRPKAKVNFYNEDAMHAIFKENYYDASFIDIDSPWSIIDKVYNALKPSGRIGILIPTYNQVDKLIPYMKDKFVDIEGVEVFLRDLRLKKGMIRPEFRMIGFTSILITGIKIL